MTKETAIKLFQDQRVRVLWDNDQEKWHFSIVDVIAVLTKSVNPQAYWRKLKERLRKEGNETVTNCHGLKMKAADGKMRMTDVADTEQLLRLIQSIPSPNAEPFKVWLAKVGYERIEETEDPEKGVFELEIDIFNETTNPPEIKSKPIIAYLGQLRETLFRTLLSNNFDSDFITKAKFKIWINKQGLELNQILCQGIIEDENGKIYEGKVYKETAYPIENSILK